MSRVMIDCTHSNLPSVMPKIKTLTAGSLVAGYVTGSPDVRWIMSDWQELPSTLTKVTIDQAFTGSPVPAANVIDVETGAFTPGNVDARQAISTAPRPTIYCSLSTLSQISLQEKWRGDVWLVLSSSVKPTVPPKVPAGFNVIGQQWNFTNPLYDESVIFDPYWPERAPIVTVPHPAAPAPPGLWKAAVIVGTGLDDKLWEATYDADTGKWTSPVRKQ